MAKTTTDATPAAITDDAPPVEVSPAYGSSQRIYAGIAQSCGGEIDPAAVTTEMDV